MFVKLVVNALWTCCAQTVENAVYELGYVENAVDKSRLAARRLNRAARRKAAI